MKRSTIRISNERISNENYYEQDYNGENRLETAYDVSSSHISFTFLGAETQPMAKSTSRPLANFSEFLFFRF